MNESVRRPRAAQPLFEGAEWDFALMQEVYEAVKDVALNDLGLDVFPNQIEVISAEQMLDAYSSVGMPLMYSHWSFGKRFVKDEMLYRKGYQALAYEIVINSNPCISYYMEENSMAMQTLVLAHAAFGHNHFFKNNYLFQQWTSERHPRLSRIFQALCRGMRGEIRAGGGRVGARRRPCATEPERVPLSPRQQDEAVGLRGAAARAVEERAGEF